MGGKPPHDPAGGPCGNPVRIDHPDLCTAFETFPRNGQAEYPGTPDRHFCRCQAWPPCPMSRSVSGAEARAASRQLLASIRYTSARAIIDKRCVIPDNTVIGEDHAEDAKRFRVTDEGVVLVCPHMLEDE